MSDFDIIGFDKVADLYPGLHAWEILVRVVYKNFKKDFKTKDGK